jgi:hypothetical protein
MPQCAHASKFVICIQDSSSLYADYAPLKLVVANMVSPYVVPIDSFNQRSIKVNENE